ncbi:calcium:proton antiporter [Robertkochia aurantiaca]|uniref:calcium:proton antiporter n=1 Tax=Robertkochia aurantiaca TaxID=2873700 RepID=UPI001CCEE502|nr:ionic transporter y4hA [Robertkochia sp. 3YJGBD-33]
MKKILKWYLLIPLLAFLAYFLNVFQLHLAGQIIVTLLLIGSILAAVFHSELIAHKVGEPFGTIILAVSVTVIEVALIISLMLAGGDKTIYLARDTVFAAVMILLTVIIGLCILIGSYKHFEQVFQKKSVNTALVSLVAILVLSLILPNFVGNEDPENNTAMLLFAAVICLIIYATFIYVQTRRHRDYFITERENQHEEEHVSMPIYISLLFLLVSLVIVVLLAKTISPTIEKIILDLGLPASLLGVIIASVILLPEAIAAIKAARKDDIQTSLNLSLGSSLAAIGLTIPTVAFVSVLFDIDIILGLDSINGLLLGLTVFTVMLSLSKGRTNILYGVILICLFATFIFTLLNP